MNRRISWVVAILLSSAPALHAQEGLSPLERGHRAFRAKRYAEAAALFDEAGDAYWLGRARFAAEDFDGAAAALLQHLRTRDGRDVSALVYLGRARLRLGKAALAVKPLARAYRLEPKDPGVLYWYALAERAAGHPERAVAPLRALADGRPSDPRPLLDLGRALYDAKRYPEAAEAFAAAVERGPDDAGAWVWLGLARFKANALDQALEALREALRRDDRRPLAHYWYGRVALARGDVARASRAFDAAVRLDPEAPAPRLWRARARLRAGERELARKELVAFAPRCEDPALLALTAQLLADAGQHDRAAATLRKALRKTPQDPSLLRALAASYEALGQLGPAQRALERALRIAPQSREAWRRLGAVHARAGRAAAARDAYRNLVEGVADPLPGDLALYGRSLLAARNPAEAARVLQRAAEAAGAEDRPALLGDLGVARYLAGDAAGAVEALRVAVRARPRDSRLHDYLGRAHDRLGQRDKARAAFLRSARPQGKDGPPSRRAAPRRALARYALQDRRPDEAERWAAEALRLDPKDPRNLELAGRVALVRGDAATAWRRLAAAVERAPRRSELLLLAGRAGVEARRPREAVPLLRRAQAAGADAGDVGLWLGKALLSLPGKAGQAVGVLERACAAAPKRVDLRLALAQAALAAQQPAKTVAALREAKRLAPRDASLRAPLVEALRAAGDPAAADEERRPWLELVHPELLEAELPWRERARRALALVEEASLPRSLVGELHLLRTELLEAGGDVAGAEAALRSAREAAPWAYRVPFAGGALAERSGQDERALERYRLAMRLAPRRAGPAVATARLLLRSGNVRGALETLTRAVRRCPNASSPVVELVRLRTLRGETDRALDRLRAARPRLSATALRVLRSDRDFAPLWSLPAFRQQVGDPLPSDFGRAGERLLETGEGVYTAWGELLED